MLAQALRPAVAGALRLHARLALVKVQAALRADLHRAVHVRVRQVIVSVLLARLAAGVLLAPVPAVLVLVLVRGAAALRSLQAVARQAIPVLRVRP